MASSSSSSTSPASAPSADDRGTTRIKNKSPLNPSSLSSLPLSSSASASSPSSSAHVPSPSPSSSQLQSQLQSQSGSHSHSPSPSPSPLTHIPSPSPSAHVPTPTLTPLSPLSSPPLTFSPSNDPPLSPLSSGVGVGVGVGGGVGGGVGSLGPAFVPTPTPTKSQSQSKAKAKATHSRGSSVPHGPSMGMGMGGGVGGVAFGSHPALVNYAQGAGSGGSPGRGGAGTIGGGGVGTIGGGAGGGGGGGGGGGRERFLSDPNVSPSPRLGLGGSPSAVEVVKQYNRERGFSDPNPHPNPNSNMNPYSSPKSTSTSSTPFPPSMTDSMSTATLHPLSPLSPTSPSTRTLRALGMGMDDEWRDGSTFRERSRSRAGSMRGREGGLESNTNPNPTPNMNPHQNTITNSNMNAQAGASGVDEGIWHKVAGLSHSHSSWWGDRDRDGDGDEGEKTTRSWGVGVGADRKASVVSAGTTRAGSGSVEGDEGGKEKDKNKEKGGDKDKDKAGGGGGGGEGQNVPPEQMLGWDVTRRRVAQAASSVLGTAALVTHELLVTSVDLLELAPVPGLQSAARTLLGIWDAVQDVDSNRLQCLRLTERCADILLSVRQEVWEAGDTVGEELRLPVGKLTESFTQIHTFLLKQSHRPFLKRYLKRDEILKQIQGCDAGLQEALGMFGLSIQIRLLKQVQLAELKRQHDTEELMREVVQARRESAAGFMGLGMGVGYNVVQAGYNVLQATPQGSLLFEGGQGVDPAATTIQGQKQIINPSINPWPYANSTLLSPNLGSSPYYAQQQQQGGASPRHTPQYTPQGSSQSLIHGLQGLPPSSSHPSLGSTSTLGSRGGSGSVTPVAPHQMPLPNVQVHAQGEMGIGISPAPTPGSPQMPTRPLPSVSITPSSRPSTAGSLSIHSLTPTGLGSSSLPPSTPGSVTGSVVHLPSTPDNRVGQDATPTPLTPTPLAPNSPAATPLSPTPSLTPLLSSPSTLSPSLVLPTLHSLTARQNAMDAEFDYADLRNLMREALSRGSDVEMMSVLEVGREDVAEAVKTLQRAHEAILERERREMGEGMEGSDMGIVAIDGVVDPRAPGSAVGGGGEGVGGEIRPSLPRTTSASSRASSGMRALGKLTKRMSLQSGSSTLPVAAPMARTIEEEEGAGAQAKKDGNGKSKRSSIGGFGGLKRSKTMSTTSTVESAASSRTMNSGSGSGSGSGKGSGSGSGESRPAVVAKDTLDREFIESGIDALRRMSRGAEQAMSLPSWTITRYEIDRNEKIGIGFFSDVYKGSWKPFPSAPSRTVAIKVLAETTPRKLFIREVGIWKTLSHPNVLELYGASSASGDPPWFFVSPYLKNGSLSEFLRKVADGWKGGPDGAKGGGPPAGLMLGGVYEGAGARSRTSSLPGWSGGGLGSLVGAHSEVGLGLGLGMGMGARAGSGFGNNGSMSSSGNLSVVEGERTGRGRSGSGSTIVGSSAGEISKEWDLLRFMHEISKGMEYLHSNGVLHGDLKAANVLVDDRIHCVISDFGQSEMKSEAFRISGTPPPHGTLRWQSPELMLGVTQFTVEMDVYAFAICCTEVLNLGRMPWPFHDDEQVRNMVLRENQRPAIPATRFTTPALADIIHTCWAQDPFQRPTFSQVARDLKALRKGSGANPEDLQSPRMPEWGEWEFQQHHQAIPSPDLHPIPLPPHTPSRDILVAPAQGTPSSSSSEDASFRTARDRELSVSPNYPYDVLSHRETAVTSAPLHMPDTVIYTPSRPPSSPTSSIFTSTPSSQSEDNLNLIEYDGYDSPPPANDRIAETRNERRYRLLLAHEFHPSLTLPLWSPAPVALGAIGYLSKPKGEFVTLFNAFNPEKALGAVKGLPSVHGYGKLSTGNQRQDKRNAAQRGLDAIAGLLTFKARGDGNVSQNVSRRYTFPLRAGHKTAYLCTETTMYRYVEKLEAPKKWFKANVDAILNVFGAHHHIQKEDLFFVIGTLDTPEYALFVSHNHPDGQAHFNVFTASKSGKPWGTFITDTETPSELGGPSYHEPMTSSPLSASKISPQGSYPWNTVLLARLRFKPDVLEPTSL